MSTRGSRVSNYQGGLSEELNTSNRSPTSKDRQILHAANAETLTAWLLLLVLSSILSLAVAPSSRSPKHVHPLLGGGRYAVCRSIIHDRAFVDNRSSEEYFPLFGEVQVSPIEQMQFPANLWVDRPTDTPGWLRGFMRQDRSAWIVTAHGLPWRAVSVGLPVQTPKGRPLILISWSRTIANVVFWFVIAWGASIAKAEAIRFLRRRRQLCLRCGYDVRERSLSRCPECGYIGR